MFDACYDRLTVENCRLSTVGTDLWFSTINNVTTSSVDGYLIGDYVSLV